MSRDYDFYWHWLESRIEKGMQVIADFLSTFHGHLTKLSRDFNERLSEYDSSADEFGDHAEQLRDEALQLRRFQQLLLNNSLASLVTFFELQVVKLTRLDFESRKRGDFLTRDDLEAAAKTTVKRYEHAQNYWNEINLRLKQEPEWQEIVNIGKVRNKVAHTGGELDSDDISNEIRSYVERRTRRGNEALTIEEDWIVVTPEYCTEVVRVYEGFLMKLLQGIQLR